MVFFGGKKLKIFNSLIIGALIRKAPKGFVRDGLKHLSNLNTLNPYKNKSFTWKSVPYRYAQVVAGAETAFPYATHGP
jgi:hypothetical protein